MADIEMRFLEEDKRETACATLQLTFTELPNDINNRLHKSLPRKICEARNINHQCTAVADLIVFRLQRGGFPRLLCEYTGIARRLKPTANCCAHPFILGKFQLLGHINEMLDTNERRCSSLPLHMPGFLEQARHAVLEVHCRHIRQAEPGQHSHQWTEPELPHAQFEIFTGFEMKNTFGAYLSRVGVHIMLRQMNVFLIQVKHDAWRSSIDQLQQDNFGQIRLASPFDAGDDIDLLQVMPLDKERLTPERLAEMQRIAEIINTIFK